MKLPIPHCQYAVIGGSSTNSIKFPEDVGDPLVRVLNDRLCWETPFGKSPPFVLFEIDTQKVLTCKMHGWRGGIDRGIASSQVFWVLREAGVKAVMSEGGVGSMRENLQPKSVVIPHDYVDFSLRRGVSLGDAFLLIMRDPLCPDLRAILSLEAQTLYSNVSQNAVYGVTEGRHFESRAEVSMYSQWGIDIVGQSLAPEVYLAREIGACYAGVYLVVNHAEGIKGDWSYEKLRELFYSESKKIGQILLKSLIKKISAPAKTCSCDRLRKPTLLKE